MAAIGLCVHELGLAEISRISTTAAEHRLPALILLIHLHSQKIVRFWKPPGFPCLQRISNVVQDSVSNGPMPASPGSPLAAIAVSPFLLPNPQSLKNVICLTRVPHSLGRKAPQMGSFIVEIIESTTILRVPKERIKASIGACKSRELICRFNGFSKVPPPASPRSLLAAIKVAPPAKDNHASLLLKPQFYKNVVCLPRVLKPQFYNNVVCLPRVSHSTGWKAHSRGFSIVYFNHLDNHTTMSTTSTPVWVSLQNLPPYL